MTAIHQWRALLDALRISHQTIPGNVTSIQLTGIDGAPILRGVETTEELSELHTKAREKSESLERVLLLALPLTHPKSHLTLPGDIVLPKLNAYGGHMSSTFSLSGHRIEPSLVREMKREVMAVMQDGTKIKTPLCDWALKLLGNSWQYGTPSSLVQLDSMIGLLARDARMLGHVRTRQLSYGRGCGDAMLLPKAGVIPTSNQLLNKTHESDFKLLGLEAEIGQLDSARMRIHAVISDVYLTVLSRIDRELASDLGCGQVIGGSRLGEEAPKPTITRSLRVTPGNEVAPEILATV